MLPLKASSSPRTSVRSLVHFAAALVVVMWGVSFVSTSVMLENGVGPIAIYVARFIVAYLLMWIVSHKRLWALSVRDELLLAACGLCGSTIYYLAENFALKYTLATNVSLITTLAPLLTMLLLGLLYKAERPTRGALIGSAIAFVGVGCVIFNSSFVMKVNPLGDLLSLAAALAFAFYTIVLRKLQALYDIGFITRKTFAYGLVTAVPFVVFSTEKMLVPGWLDPTVLANFIFLVVGCTVGAFVIWGWAVQAMGVVKASNYLYFQPVITLVFSALFLGQTVTVVGVTGMVLILLGVMLCDKLDRRERMRR